MVDLVGTTKRKAEDQSCSHQGYEETTRSTSYCQLSTHSPAHENGVVQRLANGGVSIIAHHSQQQAIGDSKTKKKEHLSGAVYKGERPEDRKEVDEHLGQYNKCVEDLRGRENS